MRLASFDLEALVRSAQADWPIKATGSFRDSAPISCTYIYIYIICVYIYIYIYLCIYTHIHCWSFHEWRLASSEDSSLGAAQQTSAYCKTTHTLDVPRSSQAASEIASERASKVPVFDVSTDRPITWHLRIIKYQTRVYEPGGRIMIHRNPPRYRFMHAWGDLGTRGGSRVCR